MEAVIPSIDAIRGAFHNLSFSVGALHHGDTVFFKGFGYADKSTVRVPNEETTYSLGYCTKAFTATFVGLLVHSGQVDWTTSISTYIPESQAPHNPAVGEKATLPEILSHSTGLVSSLFVAIGRHGSVLPQRKDVTQICSNLPFVLPFRSEWRYNNWPYALTSCLVDKISNKPWTQSVNEVLELLGMNRTYTSRPYANANFAHAYTIMSNGTAVEQDTPSLQGGDAFDGYGSIRSCVKDMMTWCKAMIEASRAAFPAAEKGSEAASSLLPDLPGQLA